MASEGLRRVAQAEPDLIYSAELYWLAVRIEADLANRQDAAETKPRERAEALASGVLASLDEVIAGMRGEGALPEAVAFRALANAELTRLRDEADPEPWRTAGELFRKLDEALRVAYTAVRTAETLTLAGAEVEERRVCLRQAHATATALGARPFQAQVEVFAQAAGISLGKPEAPASGRERRANTPPTRCSSS